jgi:threonyl-tRNA synthetase
MNPKSKIDNLESIRHTAEHILTMAMHRLYGQDKIIMAMGPAIEDGFYFDFEAKGVKISKEDFPKIEKEMAKIIQTDMPMVRKEIEIEAARKLFQGNPYKQEWLNGIKNKGEKATVYHTGSEFVDLCSGPHARSTGEVKAYKLLSVAGAYWHGDEKNKMLTRIYGTAFDSKDALKDYLWRLEEGLKRDHKKLGPALDLYVISEDIGKGLPLLTPKGAIIRNQIIAYERELETQAGFQEVWTPHIAKSDIYKRTGHWDHYRDVMYAPFGIDNETYVLKPMNCPHHYMIYESRPRSYKDLPIRLSEPGTCYRYEKSGELGGLTRVRALTIDDSHILMMESQIDAEFSLCIRLVKQMFAAFGLTDYYVRLSLNDPADTVKYIADKSTWVIAGQKLEQVIKNNELIYVMGAGEASFYGPKIDFMVKDAIGREWQMSTLQLDLFMGQRLGLEYIDSQGKSQPPVILHRGLTGSLERTIGLLIEHFAGAFPVWLAPIQAAILPIGEDQVVYGQLIVEQLKAKGIRAELWDQAESLNKRIRIAEKQKIPYMAVVGDKEVHEESVTLRIRGQKVQRTLSSADFIKLVAEKVETKALDLSMSINPGF